MPPGVIESLSGRRQLRVIAIGEESSCRIQRMRTSLLTASHGQVHLSVPQLDILLRAGRVVCTPAHSAHAPEIKDVRNNSDNTSGRVRWRTDRGHHVSSMKASDRELQFMCLEEK